jgi:antitoxin (DNA-binding transcriptional repressor) of toxin-antitoxin stability system
LLDQVSRGESFVITKRGKPMAALSPVNVPRQQGPKASLLEFRKKYAKSLKKYSAQEIKELIEFGRR